MLLYTATLKDGKVVQIRELGVEDKDKLIEMYGSLSDEALRWGMPPYSREVIEKWYGNIQNLIALVAFDVDRIVGHAQILKFLHPRRKDSGDLIIYLHQDFHNRGLGTVMLGRLLESAREQGMHRISLHVIADNRRAVHVYQKLGFKIEGTMKDSYFGEDRKYHDELMMGLLLH
jgi:RimJ/RimL family protein N-acetyltransferase